MNYFQKSSILVPTFILVLACGLTYAGPQSFELTLVAPEQSMFGSGDPNNFGYSDSYGNPNTFGESWSIGVDSGTVMGTYKGSFNIDYTDSMNGIGYVPISMSFTPDSGGVESNFGAWVEAYVYLLGGKYPAIDMGLNLTTKEVIGQLENEVSGSDSDGIFAAGPDIIIAGASIDLAATETDFFTPYGLSSTIWYSLRGSGESKGFMFSVGDGTTIANIDLDQPGIWDFSFDPFRLENSYRTDFDWSLSADAHVLGEEIHLASIPIGTMEGDPFQLTFEDERYRPNVFSVSVGEESTPVPEPNAILLLSIGLGALGLVSYRRK